ncbi:MAG: aminotransferase class I/II-fold pyridoxal phosphate-dependent enzyme [Thermoguttaceae bacterium]|nr:aminotransferase class I/II-fold pyridoxal phosphate-dependent enzyme [Thermoguttaceae bacterium]MDW8078566.1 aminotransferase class I/II-fold pyridoxal phosphate-dependent enzyme [Thermoguttaceae bacterium]
MFDRWLAHRTAALGSSVIEHIFELAAQLEDRVDLSIGQPHFEVPAPIQEAAVRAIRSGRNRYSPSQGIEPLREWLREKIRSTYLGDDRDVMITCGTSGALVLAVLALVNPGDQVILFDPWFVVYEALVKLVGAEPVYVDTYPNFRIDPEKVERAITARTKLIIVNTPNNPTGVAATHDELKALALLALDRGIALLSDEIYRAYCYDAPFVSPGHFNPFTIVADGFSKTYAAPGWRLGFIHGPKPIIDQMVKIQQYTFVCPPHPLQWAMLQAQDADVTPHIADYRRKRDVLVEGLADYYRLVRPTGAFYAFPEVPWADGKTFTEFALRQFRLLLVPGGVFSRRDTHFRIAYAVDDNTLVRGIEILRQLAKNPPSL